MPLSYHKRESKYRQCSTHHRLRNISLENTAKWMTIKTKLHKNPLQQIVTKSMSTFVVYFLKFLNEILLLMMMKPHPSEISLWPWPRDGTQIPNLSVGGRRLCPLTHSLVCLVLPIWYKKKTSSSAGPYTESGFDSVKVSLLFFSL